MASTSPDVQRRQPQQPRAEQRRAKFLQVAAELIGSSGYEAVTMTAVAERAGASIGTLYDYFPDKKTLALALLAQYTEEADVYWASVLNAPTARSTTDRHAAGRSKSAFSEFFVDAVLHFVRDRPAYLPLLAAPLVYTRSREARQPLRKTMADALRSMNRQLPGDRALIIANVLIELIKTLLSVYKRGDGKDSEMIAEEFKRLLRLYIADALA